MCRFGPNTQDVNEIDYSMNETVKDQMIGGIKTYFKNIDPPNLHLDYCGIRPKILKDGELYPDFWISEREFDGHLYKEFCGIESPGVTASIAF